MQSAVPPSAASWAQALSMSVRVTDLTARKWMAALPGRARLQQAVEVGSYADAAPAVSRSRLFAGALVPGPTRSLLSRDEVGHHPGAYRGRRRSGRRILAVPGQGFLLGVGVDEEGYVGAVGQPPQL